jgi:prophage DNA circulation protein
VVGPDYIEDAKALIGAAEEEGPGTLVHPWLGSMTVSLKDPMRVRFDSAAGHAVISFSFVEAGDLEFPSAVDSTPAQSQIAADSLCTAAAESFADSFSVDGFSAFVSDLAGTNFSDAFNLAGTLGSGFSSLSGWATGLTSIANGGLASLAGGVLNGVASGIANLLGSSLSSVLATPLSLAQAVMDVFDLSGLVAGLAGGSAAAGPTYAAAAATPAQATAADQILPIIVGLVGIAGNGGAGGVLNAPIPVAGATLSRTQQVENQAAINAVVRRALLAQAVGMSSVLDTTVQTDAHIVRASLCAALDLESLIADDVSYQALQVARRAVWADLTARSSDSARLLSYVPTEVVPALVIAYDQYEDAERAVELATRNKIIHPGFVPMNPLQVLSR